MRPEAGRVDLGFVDRPRNGLPIASHDGHHDDGTIGARRVASRITVQRVALGVLTEDGGALRYATRSSVLRCGERRRG